MGAFETNFPVWGGSPLVAFASRVRHADGHLVPIYVYGQVIMGADGRRLGGIGEWRVLPQGTTSSPDDVRTAHALPFLLHYDGDHVLTAVEPHQPFLGWDPDEVIGTHFSLAGFDRDATELMMRGLMLTGDDHSLGSATVLRGDGGCARIDIRLRLHIEDGAVRNYFGEVRVLD